MIDSALHTLTQTNNAYSRAICLKICLATTSLESFPPQVLDAWPDELIRKTWSQPDAILAALLCTLLIVQQRNTQAEILAIELLNRQPAVLHEFPAILRFIHKLGLNREVPVSLKNPIALSKAFGDRIRPLNEYLQQQSIRTVAVVGNAPALLDNRFGREIDEADCVIRFNNVVIKPELHPSTGTKTTVWSATPALTVKPEAVQNPESEASATWLSSYLPYHRSGKFWRQFAAQPVDHFIEAEHSYWIELVQTCCAPPSAGLLVVKALAATDCTTLVYGFSGLDARDRKTQEVQSKTEANVNAANHYGDKNRKSSRHNWDAEKSLLQDLTKQGIQFRS